MTNIVEPSKLGTAIIEHAVFVAHEVNVLQWMMSQTVELNALRRELSELRALHEQVKTALCVQCSHRPTDHADGWCAAVTGGPVCKCEKWYPMSHAYPLKRRDSDG